MATTHTSKLNRRKLTFKEFEDLYNRAVVQAVPISVREYMRNNVKYNNLVLSGRAFVLTNRNQEIGTFIPQLEKKKKYGLADLMKLRFKGGKNLSKNIDKIVYGI
jgi:hypothetical protein